MINLNRLKKSEILWLYSHRCKKHSHRFTEHLPCYETEQPQNSPIYEKLAHLDIETSNLKATFGIVLSYALKLDNSKILGRCLTTNEMRKGIYDRKLLAELIKHINLQDKLTVYFGSDNKFDIPFLRSRCLFYNLPFPLYKDIKVVDVYDIVKRKLCLHRNRLQTVCEFLSIPAKLHPIKSDVWLGALGGNQQALNYIFKHNKEDVISLEAVYHKVINYIGKTNRSI